MKQGSAKNSSVVLSLAQLLAEQSVEPPPGWIEPGLLPPQGILFVGGEPKIGKSLLVANLALALAAGEDRAGFNVPAARRVLVCQFELPVAQFVPGWRPCAVRSEPPPTRICWWTPAPWVIC